MMKNKQLGKIDIPLPPLGLGTWAFGGDYWGEQNHNDSVKAIHAALRRGVIHFDTAPVYGNGRAEQVAGQQLKKIRKKIILATKSMYSHGNSVLKKIDISLNRLCTDYIDIFYIHWPKKGFDFRPMMEALEQARSRGKIKAIGVSNFPVSFMRQVMEAGTIDVHQTGYNLLWRQPEKEIIPFCTENNISIVTYSSLAQGILTGKYQGIINPRFEDMRGHQILFRQDLWPEVWKTTCAFDDIAQREHISMTQLAIQWLLSRPWVTSVLLGARNRKQVEENFISTEVILPQCVVDEITAISDKLQEKLPDYDNIFNHTW